MQALTDHLRIMAAEPFSFGNWDCAMSVANWVRRRTGVDPAPELRGTYSTDAEWQAIVAREGGLMALVERLALRAGLARTDDPQPGDIGVVEVTLVGPAAAIKTERGWALKLTGGLVAGKPKMLAAWGFPD